MSLDAGTIAVLREALEDEYRARATYRKVIAVFGPIRPFVNIVEAEDRHAKALLRLFERFEIDAPPDTWANRIEAPRTLADACRAGIAGEIENEAMYECHLKQVKIPEIRSVLQRLQRASKENHLPAFRRCLEREGIQTGRPRSRPGHLACGGRRRRRD
ncbi:MAG: DUF2202 domain-containing protein [Rhodobacteraceae bacterium]|nr:DUF2202 domain-containing protein [Paracoccaceae bacterium]